MCQIVQQKLKGQETTSNRLNEIDLLFFFFIKSFFLSEKLTKGKNFSLTIIERKGKDDAEIEQNIK